MVWDNVHVASDYNRIFLGMVVPVGVVNWRSLPLNGSVFSSIGATALVLSFFDRLEQLLTVINGHFFEDILHVLF